MFFGQNRQQLRQVYLDAWRKYRRGEPLQPLEKLISSVVAMHPEYQPLLATQEQAIDKDYLPELGESNPFLHMGLHMAIQEQLGTDRPPGIAAAYRSLLEQQQDRHTVEHLVMECLAEALWQAQRNNALPDEQAYLACVTRLGSR